MPSLEVVLGLLLIILFYSLLATVLLEVLAGLLHSRGRFLDRIVSKLLGEKTFDNGADKTLYDLFKDNALYEHISGKAFGKTTPPSYIEAGTFRTILLQVVQTFREEPNDRDLKGMIQNLPEGRVKEVLLGFYEEAENRYDLSGIDDRIIYFSTRVEQWYEDIMDRASGWYKRNTQVILFFIGLTIAGFNNVDVISVFRNLSEASVVELEEIADIATAIGERDAIFIESDSLGNRLPSGVTPDGTVVDTAVVEFIRNKVEALNNPFGVGWTQYVLTDETGEQALELPSGFTFWFLKILGIIITAICVSKGAAFWFDLLKQVVAFRNTGAVPARTNPNPVPVPVSRGTNSSEPNQSKSEGNGNQQPVG